MIKVGFIYFDDIHIIPHFLGTLAELYKDPECEVDILAPDISHSYLYELLDLLEVPRDVVKILPTYWFKRVAYKIQGRKKPSNRYIFKKHQRKLLDYDVLAFNVFNHGHIKRSNRNKPKFVFLMHGAGDHKYPFTKEYKPAVNQFDLVTVAGQKVFDLFQKNAPYPDTQFKICGYSKFDVVQKIQQNQKKLFPNDKPIVLYNPHFRKHLTSFTKFGKDILEFFYRHQEYNLIFAPHMNLFSNTVRDALDRNLIPSKYFEAENIIIDFGSKLSADMTYTYHADIYMGDVSSQIYEFLIRGGKPAIFLNAHNFNWESDVHFQSWHFGKVLDRLEHLKEILDARGIWQKDFEEKQQKAMAYTFDITPHKSASKRVAEAIKNLGTIK